VTDLLAAIFVAFNYEKYIAVLSHPQTGPQPRKNFGGGKVTFSNHYDLIDVQSTMMRLFCYDQLPNIGGGTFSIVGGHGRP